MSGARLLLGRGSRWLGGFLLSCRFGRTLGVGRTLVAAGVGLLQSRAGVGFAGFNFVEESGHLRGAVIWKRRAKSFCQITKCSPKQHSEENKSVERAAALPN